MIRSSKTNLWESHEYPRDLKRMSALRSTPARMVAWVGRSGLNLWARNAKEKNLLFPSELAAYLRTLNQ